MMVKGFCKGKIAENNGSSCDEGAKEDAEATDVKEGKGEEPPNRRGALKGVERALSVANVTGEGVTGGFGLAARSRCHQDRCELIE